MSRPMTGAGLREEAQCELVALGHELLRHDQWELAQYEAIDALLAGSQVTEARALLSTLRRKDIERENRAHRAIVSAARGLAS